MTTEHVHSAECRCYSEPDLYSYRIVTSFVCDWMPDDLNPGPDCPYCAGDMCARLDGLGCTHDRVERHG